MANLTFPDPAITQTCTVLVQSSEGAANVTVRFGSDFVVPYGTDPEAPDALPVDVIAAWVTLRDLLLEHAKARLVAQAAENGDTLTFINPGA